MSDNPILADNKPIKVILQQGQQYCFCCCGRSLTQPLCDGSHASTRLSPKVFIANKTGPVMLCRCKQSKNLPYCDGSHSQYSTADIG
ncbi:MAG: CDGSH iron-sulfur domain-containing protein [Pseudomonadales bacterium]|nr:CDGSH iron-sulfur domain-containing protein [Pseudomonadales bacterium]